VKSRLVNLLGGGRPSAVTFSWPLLAGLWNPEHLDRGHY